MTMLLLLATVFAPAAEIDIHEKANPIYQQLRHPGIMLASNRHIPLPAPVMADGLDAKGQQAILKKLLADDIDLEDFLQDSVTAPQLLKRPEEKQADVEAPVRFLELYFVAFGDLDTLTDRPLRQRLVAPDRRKASPKTLTPDELYLRGITIAQGGVEHEEFSYLQANILVRVQVRAVAHSYWSRSLDSIVIASELDDRFATDRDFPNQWRPLIKEDDEHEVKEGPPQPYRGAAYYLKITRLKNPTEAVFVEAHIGFTEPRKWFNGENVLRSRLPAATMSMVRHFRRELIRASRKPDEDK